MKSPSFAASGLLCLAALGVNAAPIVITQDFETCANVAACGASVTFAGDASAASVNLRQANNTINTSVNDGFDGFFGSRFMVIGDDSGNMAGEPNGQTNGALSRASFGLGNLDAGTYTFAVSFDYVADSRSPAPNPDDFSVLFETAPGAASALATVLQASDIAPNSAAFREVGFSWLGSFTLAAASDVYLSFELEEFNGDASAAAGIDNLSIRQIPEPGTLALVGLALVGASLRRRR